MGTSILEGRYIYVRCITHIISFIIVDDIRERSELVAHSKRVVKCSRQSLFR